LSDQVDRTMQVTGNLLVVALAIQSALQTQLETARATKALQEYTGELLVQNAKSVRQQTAQISEMAANPVIALEKMNAAFDELMVALDESKDRLKKSEAAARQASAQIEQRTDQLQPKVAGLRAATRSRISASAAKTADRDDGAIDVEAEVIGDDAGDSGGN
jgi:uncharacterized protein YaaN involved in tellurite resistance